MDAAPAKDRRLYFIRRYAERRLWLIEYLERHPCVDCGEVDYRLLDFDHRDRESKTLKVSAMVGWAWQKLRDEVAKCDVRCVKCHRLRTIEQLGHYRHALALREERKCKKDS